MNRRVEVEIVPQTGALEKVIQKIESMNKEKVVVSCSVDIDGKSVKTDLENVLADVAKSGLNQKVSLELNTNVIYKQIGALRKMAEKTADAIHEDFKKATAVNNTDYTKKLYMGKTKFSDDNEAAIQELIKYRNAAIEKVKSVEFDFSNMTSGMDEKSVMAYATALKRLEKVLEEVDQVASSRGIKLPEIDKSFNIDTVGKKLSGLESSAFDLVHKYAEQQIKEVQEFAVNLRKEFASLVEMLQTGARATQEAVGEVANGTGIDSKEVSDLIALFKELKDAILNISNAIGTIDDKAGFAPLLSSIKQISDYLGKASKEMQDFVSKGLSLNLNLGGQTKTNPIQQNRKYGQTARKAIAEYKLAYEEIQKIVTADTRKFNQYVRNTNLAYPKETDFMNQYYTLASKVGTGNLDEQVSTYNNLVKMFEKIAKANNLDISDWESKFKVSLDAVSDSMNKVMEEAPNLENVFKNIFGGDNTFNFKGISDQIDGLIKKLDELFSKISSEDFKLKVTFDEPVKGSKGINLSSLTKALNGLSEDKVSILKELSGMSFEGLSSAKINSSFVKGIKALADMDLSNLDNLKELDLSKLSNIKASKKSLINLAEGIEKLSKVEDISRLKALQGIDFSGLGGLKNIKKATESSIALSQDFTKTQQKRIDEAMKSARKAGVPEDNLGELKSLSSLLRDQFNAANIGTMDDLNGSMQDYNALVDTAVERIDQMVAGIKAANDAQMSNDKALKDYLALINERGKLGDKIASGQWDNEDTEQFKQYMQQMKETRKANKNNPLFDNANALADAQMKDIKENYSKMLKDTLAIGEKYEGADFGTNEKYTELAEKMKSLTELMNTFEENHHFINPEDIVRAIQLREEIEKIDVELVKQGIKPNAAKTTYNKLNKKYGDLNPEDYVNAEQTLNDIKTRLQEIQNISKKGVLGDVDKEKVEDLEKEIDKLGNSLIKKQTNKGSFLTQISAKNTKEGMDALKDFIRAQEEAKGNKVTFSLPKDDYTKLEYSARTKSGAVENYVATMDRVDGSVRTAMKSEAEYVSAGRQFLNSLKGKFAELTKYITVMDVFRKVMGFVKQGFQSVVEINTAMTELKKVTDETAESYSQFKKVAGEAAKEVGSTPKDIISSTGDFARLGYDIKQSTELAKNAAIYKNVGEGIDITTATEDIVSAMKAFDIQAEKSSKIIDIYNEVGNKFAISSAGLGEAMQKSSSTLAAGNNSFEESVALAAAMNEILQDPGVTGSTLKILSLRLRGAKSEIEEMGESTDDMAESTSQLRDQIKAFTNIDGKGGFDIMESDGKTFKSLFEMMQGISKVWKDMSDVNQAGLLEKISGKNRAQGAAALLSSFSQAEKALEVAQNASGSAAKENEKQLESIQGKIQLLQSSFQNLWSNAVDDSVIAKFIGLGSKILDLVDKIGLLKTAVGALAAVASFKGAGRVNKSQLSLMNMPAINRLVA